MYSRYILIFALLSLTGALFGQFIDLRDTVRIGEVLISVDKSSGNLSPYRKETIDSALIAARGNNTLGELLAGNTSVYIKSYGPGGVSSPSLRGTGAGHTQVTWNGISINNSMLGQCDLSTVPAGIADNVELFYGASSMQMGIGGLGGTVNISNDPEWIKGPRAYLSAGMGSFGRILADARFSAGSAGFQSSTRLYFNSAVNDFPYTDNVSSAEPFSARRNHSEVNQRGVLQELYVRNGNTNLSAKFWYAFSDKNLPGSLLMQSDNTEKQRDESFRSVIEMNHNTANLRIFAVTAFISDRLNYVNDAASIDSRNISSSLTFKGGIDFLPGKSSKLTLGLSDEINFVRSGNYDGDKSRNIAAITASAEKHLGGRFSSSLLIRQIITGNRLLVPDFTGAMSFKVLPIEELYLKASISRNSRLATMNDLFWNPGGNPDLKNEYAFQYEGGVESKFRIQNRLAVDLNLTLYRYNIHNMIQWLPGEFSYWQPANVDLAMMAGVESAATLVYKSGPSAYSLRAAYSYNSARKGYADDENENAGMQLMYIPEHKASLTLRMESGKFSTAFENIFTGMRYTSADNSKFLPNYILGSFDTSYRISISQHQLILHLLVDNLYNVDYESVAYYPMPGISYLVKLSFIL